MPNLRKLLTFMLIGASTFGFIESTDEDVTSKDCPMGQVDMSLDLVNVGLIDLPHGFIKNKFLTHLTLDDNQLTAVPAEAFTFIPRLSYLSLANNRLESLNLAPFIKLSNLKTLILNNNCKSETVTKHLVPDEDYDQNYNIYNYHRRPPTTSYSEVNYCSLEFDIHFPSLTHLYLEHNDLQNLYFLSGELSALTHLYLSNNPLVINETIVSGLNRFAPALTHLYLQDCGLITFDTSQLPSLTALYLGGNEIQSICSKYCEGRYLKLENAEKLTTLSVSRNKISKMEPDSFNFTVNLMELDLSHNHISEIREGTFDKLYRLQSLSLEHNQLVQLEASNIFRGLVNLESLFLGANAILVISSGLFDNLSTLKHLMINDSELSEIDSGTFLNLTSLEVLSLADNHLWVLPEELLPFSGSLITLNLDNNRFTSTKHIYLDNQPNMISLSLKNNPLADISATWFLNGPANLTIILGNTC